MTLSPQWDKKGWDMANVQATPPEECPECERPKRWSPFFIDDLVPPGGFWYCVHKRLGVDASCNWPINRWTPESDDYAANQTTWVDVWWAVTGT